MSKATNKEQACDAHKNELAVSVCIKHHNLLCLDCIVHKKKTDCDLKIIEKLLPAERHLYELLIIKKSIVEKKGYIDTHTESVQEKSKELKAEIKAHTERLIQEIKECEVKTAREVELQSKILLDRDEEEIRKIKSLEDDVLKKIGAISTIDNEALESEIELLHEQEANVMNLADLEVLSRYIETLTLTNVTDTGCSGKIEIFDFNKQDDYLGPLSKDKQSMYESSSKGEENNPNESALKSPAPVGPKSTNILNEQSNEAAVTGDTTEVAISDIIPLPNAVSKKKRWPPFQSDKLSRSKDKEDCQIKSKDQLKPKGIPDFSLLKDRELQLSQFVSKMGLIKIRSLVVTGSYQFVLLDEQGNLMLTDMTGHIHDSMKLKPSDMPYITSYDSHSVAMLQNREQTINIVNFNNGKLTKAKALSKLKQRVTVTGFDYHEDTHTFAISGYDGDKGCLILVHVDKQSQEECHKFDMRVFLKSCPNENDVHKTMYDFQNEALYVLNVTYKTLKRFDFSTNSFKWKRKIDEKSFSPQQMTADSSKLYVTSMNCVVVFEKKTGDYNQSLQADKLGNDVLNAICLIPNERLVVSSCVSEDPQKAATLVFVDI
ncbi:uncharacterized protein LOC128236850 [Mya arenaria]|uniref:uncharacterized protein LOC128236850 n=1 Tax=Mya arenaria TaxID=6604 RepID=UPI0022E8F5CE|nr:uncharacterized protein LOC128236850 [Mya arenaria]XP_052807945.1 uncharacterized protein LOC128236850 [Mya arenaria]